MLVFQIASAYTQSISAFFFKPHRVIDGCVILRNYPSQVFGFLGFFFFFILFIDDVITCVRPHDHIRPYVMINICS